MLVLMRGMGVLLFYDAPLRQPAVVVRVRAAGTAHPPGRELYRAGRWRDREARAGLAAHAPPLLRLLSSRPGHGPADHAGLIWATAIPSTQPITAALPGIGSKGCGSSLWPKPAVTPPPKPDAQPHMREPGGVGCRSMQHNQILNGASVIFSPFIGVQLTSWKARTQPQVPPFLMRWTAPVRSFRLCGK